MELVAIQTQFKDLNFTILWLHPLITIGYEIPMFRWYGPFSKRGGERFRKFWPEAEILGIF